MPYKDPEKTKEYDRKRSKTPKFKEYQRNWREKNNEKCIGYHRNWRSKNIEKCREAIRNWRLKHPEKCKQYDKKYEATHRKEYNEKRKKYYYDNKEHTNKEQYNEHRRNWRKSNPDKLRKIYAKHYAKRRDLDYVELNDYFEGSEGHHIDKECVVYIPVWLHKFIYHNVFTGYNMAVINDLVFEYLELTNELKQQSL